MPYEEKKKDTNTPNKSTDTKITEIVNNNKIDKVDKVKLINELLIQNQQNKLFTNASNTPVINADETYDDSFENSNNYNDDFNQTNNLSNQTLVKRKSILKTTKLQTTKKKKISKLKDTLEKLNQTIKDGYLNLPPGFATREQTKNFIEKVNHTRLEKNINKRKDPRSLIGSNVIQKAKSHENDIKKKKRKIYLDLNRETFLDTNTFRNKNNNLLDKSHSMEVTQEGNGWIYYKNHGKNLY